MPRVAPNDRRRRARAYHGSVTQCDAASIAQGPCYGIRALAEPIDALPPGCFCRLAKNLEISLARLSRTRGRTWHAPKGAHRRFFVEIALFVSRWYECWRARVLALTRHSELDRMPLYISTSTCFYKCILIFYFSSSFITRLCPAVSLFGIFNPLSIPRDASVENCESCVNIEMNYRATALARYLTVSLNFFENLNFIVATDFSFCLINKFFVEKSSSRVGSMLKHYRTPKISS